MQKSKNIILIAVLVIVTISVPFIINESYKENSGYLTLWGADDVLSFYGSILAFFGTISLGLLAYSQNKKAEALNIRLTRLEEEKFKLEFQPFVMICDWGLEEREVLDIIIGPDKLYYDIGGTQFHDSCLCLSIRFTNTSNTFLMASYTKAVIYDNDKKIDTWGWGTSNINNPKLYLESGASGEMVFYALEDKMSKIAGNTICLELTLENRYAQRYKEKVDILIPSLSKSKSGSWYITLIAQNYVVDRYITNKSGEIVLENEVASK